MLSCSEFVQDCRLPWNDAVGAWASGSATRLAAQEDTRLKRALQSVSTVVCERNTPPENKTHWNISFQGTKSGAGLQFLLPGHVAKAHVKGVFLSQTPVPQRFNIISVQVCFLFPHPRLQRCVCKPKASIRSSQQQVKAMRLIEHNALILNVVFFSLLFLCF